MIKVSVQDTDGINHRSSIEFIHWFVDRDTEIALTIGYNDEIRYRTRPTFIIKV